MTYFLFKVQGSGFKVQGSGFKVQGSGFRVQGSGFRVQGSGFRVQGSGGGFAAKKEANPASLRSAVHLSTKIGHETKKFRHKN